MAVGLPGTINSQNVNAVCMVLILVASKKTTLIQSVVVLVKRSLPWQKQDCLQRSRFCASDSRRLNDSV